jgi:hypothetical protein
VRLETPARTQNLATVRLVKTPGEVRARGEFIKRRRLPASLKGRRLNVSWPGAGHEFGDSARRQGLKQPGIDSLPAVESEFASRQVERFVQSHAWGQITREHAIHGILPRADLSPPAACGEESRLAPVDILGRRMNVVPVARAGKTKGVDDKRRSTRMGRMDRMWICRCRTFILSVTFILVQGSLVGLVCYGEI